MDYRHFFRSLGNLIKSPDHRFQFLAKHGFYKKTDDELYLKKMFKAKMGYYPDLSSPKTFNEKIQWLKLHDRKPIYTTMVDKCAAKEYVAGMIGKEHIIPTIGVWDRVEDIDFDSLPRQFVLKCTHDSHGLVICRDKSTLDTDAAKKKLKKAMKRNYYYPFREWPYKNVRPRIIAEEYMVDDSGTELKDYKFMCFDGEVKCSFVCSERFTKSGIRVTFYDNDWNEMPFERHYPRSSTPIKKPVNYDDMVRMAEALSKDIPFVRVDFYEVQGKAYFGELTLYPGSGFEEFTPDEWDLTLGSWIKLPDKTDAE